MHTWLSGALARMGHGDIILIGDAGCAFPPHGEIDCIDLAVTDGVPMVSDVLKAVLEELEVESYIVAEETKQASPESYGVFRQILSGFENNGGIIKEKSLPHARMKAIWLGQCPGEQMKVFVRTGERTPYGYIMLVAGVNF